MTKNGTATPSEDPRATEQALRAILDQVGPLLGDDVDLTVFAGKVARFTVTDTRGKDHVFSVPLDLPFLDATAFLNGYDRWTETRYQQVVAQQEAEAAGKELEEAVRASATPRARAKLDRAFAASKRKLESAKRRTDEVFGALMGPFSVCLQIRHPDVTADHLRTEYGATMLEDWVMALVLQLNKARYQAFSGGFEAVLAGGGGPKPPAKPKTRTRRR